MYKLEREDKMKKAINQSILTYILNGITILALVFMVFSLFDYGKISNLLDKAHEERFELTYQANRFMNGSAYLTNEVRGFAATGDQQHYDNYWNEVNHLKNRDLGIAAMQEIGITEAEQAMIDEMFALSNDLVPLEDEAMKEVQAGNREDAISYVYGTEYHTSITKINALKEEFLTMLGERTSNRVNTLTHLTEYIKVRMVISFLFVGVIQLINMLVIRFRVLRPVVKIRDQMKEISKGNLSADFALTSDTSEIGMLVESIYETKRELKKYIQDIDHKLAQMAKGNMNLSINMDYRGEFKPIQNAMSQILDALNHALFQINLTAEQVSVEAARAGEAGKGFAVVADEVQSLANKSSASAQNITELIESSMSLVQHGTELSADTTKALEAVVVSAEKSTQMVDRIAESAVQQSQSLRQIKQGMEQISDVVQTNASATEESASTAQELRNQAQELKVSVQQFQLRRR